jgi:hypothetical protein
MTIKIGSVYEVTFRSGNTSSAFSWPSKIPDSGNKYMKNKVIKITKKLNPKDSLDYDYVGDIYDKIDGAVELKNIKIVSDQLLLKSSTLKVAGKGKKSKKRTKKSKKSKKKSKKKISRKTRRSSKKTRKRKMEGGTSRLKKEGIFPVGDYGAGEKLKDLRNEWIKEGLTPITPPAESYDVLKRKYDEQMKEKRKRMKAAHPSSDGGAGRGMGEEETLHVLLDNQIKKASTGEGESNPSDPPELIPGVSLLPPNQSWVIIEGQFDNQYKRVFRNPANEEEFYGISHRNPNYLDPNYIFPFPDR